MLSSLPVPSVKSAGQSFCSVGVIDPAEFSPKVTCGFFWVGPSKTVPSHIWCFSGLAGRLGAPGPHTLSSRSIGASASVWSLQQGS